VGWGVEHIQSADFEESCHWNVCNEKIKGEAHITTGANEQKDKDETRKDNNSEGISGDIPRVYRGKRVG